MVRDDTAAMRRRPGTRTVRRGPAVRRSVLPGRVLPVVRRGLAPHGARRVRSHPNGQGRRSSRAVPDLWATCPHHANRAADVAARRGSGQARPTAQGSAADHALRRVRHAAHGAPARDVQRRVPTRATAPDVARGSRVGVNGCVPTRPPHACTTFGCPEVIPHGSRCPRHGRAIARAHDAHREKTTARGYGADWRAKRDRYLREHPICAHCQREGRIVTATDVDHVLPRANGGTDDDANLQALCHSHHSRKTATHDGGFRGRVVSRG